MIDATPELAQMVAERMRALVEALPPRQLGNDEVTLTLSAGVACRVPRRGESPSDLLQTADDALYKAKRAGRNRVVSE
jgi:diguanylate cyclase (GGDEF)-like protein